ARRPGPASPPEAAGGWFRRRVPVPCLSASDFSPAPTRGEARPPPPTPQPGRDGIGAAHGPPPPTPEINGPCVVPLKGRFARGRGTGRPRGGTNRPGRAPDMG